MKGDKGGGVKSEEILAPRQTFCYSLFHLPKLLPVCSFNETPTLLYRFCTNSEFNSSHPEKKKERVPW